MKIRRRYTDKTRQHRARMLTRTRKLQRSLKAAA